MAKYHGKGKCTYPDGSVYEGEFKYGKREGQGTQSDVDRFGNVKNLFEGTFKHDKRYGKGTLSRYNRNGDLLNKITGWWDGKEFVGTE